LRELARLHASRDPTPSAAIIESQSVKTHQGGLRGFDGAKQVAGRKRHRLFDTEGNLLVVIVHPANVHDRDGGHLVLEAAADAFPRLQRIWANQRYAGGLRCWAAGRFGLVLEVVSPSASRLSLLAAPEALCPRAVACVRLCGWFSRAPAPLPSSSGRSSGLEDTSA
jgi:hypothetical protein